MTEDFNQENKTASAQHSRDHQKTLTEKSNGFASRSHSVPLVTTLLIAIIFFSMTLQQLTQAQPSPDEGTIDYPFADISEDVNYPCEPDMDHFASERLKDFRIFLENNFQNKSSTTSLLEPAMGKYRELRQVLMKAYSGYFPNQGALLTTTGVQTSECYGIINDTLSEARTLLISHATRTSGVKKTTALLEKYKAINNELQGLGQHLTRTKAYLDAFSQKMPCYVPKGSCVKN